MNHAYMCDYGCINAFKMIDEECINVNRDGWLENLLLHDDNENWW